MWQNWQIWGMFWYKETISCARQRKPWFLVRFILISNEENYFPPDLKWQKNLLVACSGFLSSKRPDLKWHACSILILSSGLHNLLHPCIRDARKWRENEKMKRKRRECEEVERKWRGNEEMKIENRMRKWRDICSLNFPIFSLFPPSLSISYNKHCHKMLITALLSRMSQKT